MPANVNLARLHEAGVSIWLDTLSRRLLDSGEFADLIRDCSVTGATSNPTIFAKAITGSDLYDGQLRRLAAGGHDTQELFFSLALDDVRAAARQLRPAYDASEGRDGFISFECTPDLADDAEAGIDLEAITDELEREGLRSFCDSYRQLLACIESRLGKVKGWSRTDAPTVVDADSGGE